MSNRASNPKWLAGVRPRSIATRSAISPSAGTVARRSAPPRTGTWPPAAASWRMLIVPPVKTTATRVMARSACGAGGRLPVALLGDLRFDLGIEQLRLVAVRIGRDDCSRDRGFLDGALVDCRDRLALLVEEVLGTRDLCAECPHERVAAASDARPRHPL